MSDADAVGEGRVVYITARLATSLIVGESHALMIHHQASDTIIIIYCSQLTV